jgi:hypothetical protein
MVVDAALRAAQGNAIQLLVNQQPERHLDMHFETMANRINRHVLEYQPQVQESRTALGEKSLIYGGCAARFHFDNS